MPTPIKNGTSLSRYRSVWKCAPTAGSTWSTT